ncbi:MAG: hypothetical protein ACE5JM_14895, partial [Armatimonadota bacterium]
MTVGLLKNPRHTPPPRSAGFPARDVGLERPTYAVQRRSRADEPPLWGFFNRPTVTGFPKVNKVNEVNEVNVCGGCAHIPRGRLR